MSETLPSWNSTVTKTTLLDFVAAVSDEKSPDYVPPEERLAVFDNDGTLWCEKPLYIQLDYLLRQFAAQAEQDPALREKQPWQAAWHKDYHWQAAWHKDYHWLGQVVTRHYQGDDADLQVLLGGILTLAHDQPVE